MEDGINDEAERQNIRPDVADARDDDRHGGEPVGRRRAVAGADGRRHRDQSPRLAQEAHRLGEGHALSGVVIPAEREMKSA